MPEMEDGAQQESIMRQVVEEQLPVVLSSEAMFQPAISHLTTLQTCDLPGSRAFVSLVELQPRLKRAMEVQDQQAKEVDELRQRSAAILERWYEGTVLENGQQWVEWDDRLSKVELAVRRAENVRSREKMEV